MRGLPADELRDISLTDDLSAVRLVFSSAEEPFYVELPVANAVIALPLLIKALNVARGIDDTAARISVPLVDANAERGEVTLVLENSTGSMSYSLDTEMVLQLTALLDHFLRKQLGFMRRP
jgi:hypothetical protein